MILNLTKSEFEKESFWAFDTTSVVDRIQIWRHTLPRIEVFYATKCNPDFEICKKVVEMDCGFDVASIQEMTDVVKLGGNPENMIFANPVKQAK
jgi:ornithine decarboxylase